MSGWGWGAFHALSGCSEFGRTVTIVCIANVTVLLFYAVLLVTARTEMLKSLRCLKMLPSPVIVNYEEVEVDLRPKCFADFWSKFFTKIFSTQQRILAALLTYICY